jgi:hypothetical protein
MQETADAFVSCEISGCRGRSGLPAAASKIVLNLAAHRSPRTTMTATAISAMIRPYSTMPCPLSSSLSQFIISFMVPLLSQFSLFISRCGAVGPIPDP